MYTHMYHNMHRQYTVMPLFPPTSQSGNKVLLQKLSTWNGADIRKAAGQGKTHFVFSFILTAMPLFSMWRAT